MSSKIGHYSFAFTEKIVCGPALEIILDPFSVNMTFVTFKWVQVKKMCQIENSLRAAAQK